MFGLSPWELLLVVLAILLLFGAKRLPDIAQGLGKGIREFKRAMRDTTDEIKGGSIEERPAPRPKESPDNTGQRSEPK